MRWIYFLDTAHARIVEGLAGVHSGMTAEDDNCVLMQKIVKDILADTKKKRFISSLSSLNAPRDRFYQKFYH